MLYVILLLTTTLTKPIESFRPFLLMARPTVGLYLQNSTGVQAQGYSIIKDKPHKDHNLYQS